MRTEYNFQIHEEAILENRKINEESYCPICGDYDIKLGLGNTSLHECSQKTLRRAQQTQRSNHRNNKIPTPSLATQLKDGFEMFFGDEIQAY